MTKSSLMLVVMLVFLTPILAQQEQPKPAGVLSTLKVGKAVNLKDDGQRYLITVIDGEMNLPQSHKVLEVGTDFIVLEDFTGFNETRIPLTSIKAVVHFKGFERK